MNSDVTQFILTIVSLGGAIVSLIFGVARHKKVAIQIASAFLMMVGVIVIIGYLTDSPQVYTFPKTKIGMALPTGVCFSIVGCCLWVIVDSIVFKK